MGILWPIIFANKTLSSLVIKTLKKALQKEMVTDGLDPPQ